MTFDKEIHKQITLDMLSKATCPVPFIEQMREFLEAVKAASVDQPSTEVTSIDKAKRK